MTQGKLMIIRTWAQSSVPQRQMTATLTATMTQRGEKGQQKARGNHQDVKMRETKKLVDFFLVQWLQLVI